MTRTVLDFPLGFWFEPSEIRETPHANSPAAVTGRASILNLSGSFLRRYVYVYMYVRPPVVAIFKVAKLG